MWNSLFRLENPNLVSWAWYTKKTPTHIGIYQDHPPRTSEALTSFTSGGAFVKAFITATVISQSSEYMPLASFAQNEVPTRNPENCNQLIGWLFTPLSYKVFFTHPRGGLPGFLKKINRISPFFYGESDMNHPKRWQPVLPQLPTGSS